MEASRLETDDSYEQVLDRRTLEIDRQIAQYCAGVRSEPQGFGEDLFFPTEAYLSILEREGSRMRGTLSTVGHDLVRGDNEEGAIQTATIIERLHAWSLVLDDDQDDAEIRRDDDAAHIMVQKELWGRGWNTDQRSLAGSLVINAATAEMLKAIEELNGLDVKDQTRRLLVDTITKTTRRAAVGQNFDITSPFRENIAEDDIIDAYASKTGQLLLGSIQAGMAIGGASEEELIMIEEFAISAGIAYQIADDLIVMSPGIDRGKDPANDLKQGKMTFVIHSALNNSSISLEDRTFLRKHLGNYRLSDDQYDHCRAIISSSRAVGHSLNTIEEYVGGAIDSLNVEAPMTWDERPLELLKAMARSILDNAQQAVR